jgi:cytochrome P450
MTTTAVDFDPFSDEYFDDPSDVYRRLREEAPVFYSEKYDFFALSRHADVVDAHRDWQTFSSSHGPELGMMRRPVEEIAAYRSIIMMDPPHHDRLRALVSRVFTPRSIAALEPMIREVISGLLTPLEDLDHFDAVEQFSAPFPVEIISRMLGVPAPDRQQLRHWLDLSLTREHGSMETPPAGQQAVMDAGIYFYELVGEKRRNPADDMLSRLTEVEVERDDGSRTKLDDAEIAGFATLLGGAGAETVTKLVGNAVATFAQWPGEWAKVVDDPTAVPRAVEELLRFLPPSQYQGRWSMTDREYEHGTIEAGHPVLLITGAATHDPRAFEEPERFDIDRPPSVAIALGHGIHSCLGAALARMESRVAIEELAKRWTSWEVDTEGLRRVHMSNVAGYSHVPITVTRR